jgi:biopolymer transport protein TolQ
VNPELSQDLSLLHLILNASLPVQLVMALLLGASLMSWWFIFIKMFALKRALRVTDRFEREFWGGGDINAMYKEVGAERGAAGEMARIFEAGFR